MVVAELQAPLKSRYRDDPGAARLTLRARGTLGTHDLTCRIDAPGGPVEAGLHPPTGGDGSFACYGDMLLQALVACAGVTMQSVATSIGIAVSGSVEAEGDHCSDGHTQQGHRRASPG